MSALALAHDAVNLGQGYPDDDGPDEVKDAVVAAIRDGRNQYAPGHGVGPLRAAIVDHQQRFYGMELDPDDEVSVSAGATEALCATILALCEVGDEVITFEPYYDS
ncbi:MAG: aminotransferase class I/II-fold pyridoxal phosphate-dependent enzyme, partial [Actinobacteria bacterium]|nr:aminotransferase class I/II-fold pyridoxal phosphate-dependent enzyme [Actinomycetota bacterium]